MTDEASKTHAVRGPQFVHRFLQGRVIDIGCGADLVTPHAEPFDLAHGDAQEIARVRTPGSYDAVHSSHCLEHMRDVPRALSQWWSLVRPGGYLIVVVPDEDLYEQGGWPSLFNPDHKATFRFRKERSWSAVSFDLEQLARQLPGAEIVSYERHDQGYRHALRRSSLSRLDRALFSAGRLCSGALGRVGIRNGLLHRSVGALFQALGAPVDQTRGDALAQIQIVVRKRAQ